MEWGTPICPRIEVGQTAVNRTHPETHSGAVVCVKMPRRVSNLWHQQQLSPKERSFRTRARSYNSHNSQLCKRPWMKTSSDAGKALALAIDKPAAGHTALYEGNRCSRCIWHGGVRSSDSTNAAGSPNSARTPCLRECVWRAWFRAGSRLSDEN